jgi:hypothetical protein
MSGDTDFEQFALAGSPVHARDRDLLLTIDFEAFNHQGPLELWLEALERWSLHSAKRGWGFSVFLALEDVVQLRHDRSDQYRAFLDAMRAMACSGAAIYPHNHGVFDSRTGRQAESRPQHVPDYRKRASFFYDVVHRHGADLGEWLGRLLGHYAQFLEDAEILRPERLAFRAGGWDHGATREENALFIDAVCDAGFAYDSSVSSGNFGTKDFRIGASFGSNIFTLKPSLIEVAPCWSYDCGAGSMSRASIGSLGRLVGQPEMWARRRQAGAFVVVLHFDHLFRPSQSGGRGISASTVNRRVDRFFGLMHRLKGLLGLSAAITFEQLALVQGENSTP